MKIHPMDEKLPDDQRLVLNNLLAQRKLTIGIDGSGEYQRLTAKIHYLRYGPQALYDWRSKNKGRISYERVCGIAYKSRAPAKPLTPEQKKAHREAMIRHEAKNPQRALRHNLERILHSIYRACAAGKPIESRRAESLLGCSIHEFKRHIKDQLVRLGMTWGQWKTLWTIDHVVPVRRFQLPKEQFACWNYTNLRPLPKHLNHRTQRN